MRLTFLNQPLKEVGLRYSFADPLPLTPELIADFAQVIDKETQVITRSDMVDTPPGVATPLVQVGHGTTLASFKIGQHNGVNIYLQENMVAARWKGINSTDVQAYPRFPAMKLAIAQTLEQIEKITGKAPDIAVCNLFYQNVFDTLKSESLFEYVNRDFFPKKLEGDLLSYDYVWALDIGDIRIDLKIEHSDCEKNTVNLQTISGRTITSSDDINQVPNNLNLALNALFNDLITQRTKDEWQLQQ